MVMYIETTLFIIMKVMCTSKDFIVHYCKELTNINISYVRMKQVLILKLFCNVSDTNLTCIEESSTVESYHKLLPF